MATTASPKSYFIIPGFAEGRLQMRVLEAALYEQGFIRSVTQGKADILIGHSGGCLLINSPNSVLINPTVWPQHRFIFKYADKMRKDIGARLHNHKFVWLPLKLLANCVYLLTRPVHNTKMLIPYLKANRLGFSSPLACVIIRNADDSWCAPQIADYYPSAKVVELPGDHDDCWDNPKPYIEIIKSYG